VICTRDRPAALARAVQSVLEAGAGEVVVVDQSDRIPVDRTLEAAPGVRVVHYTGSGLSRARNEGVRLARGDVVAFTDDDCEAVHGWGMAIARALEEDPRLGVLFGSVLAGPHDPVASVVPAYVLARPVLARSPHERARIQGMGACMAVRRAAWERVEGFDELLGAGAPLRAAEEGDLAARALRAGFRVLETPAVAVVHHGVRDRAAIGALVWDYWFGTGAMVAKHARCRDPSLVPLMPRLAMRWLGGSGSRVAASLGPHRAERLSAFVQGVATGARAPLDRRRGHFRAAP
jgi:GT2 family glycosyltransferase